MPKLSKNMKKHEETIRKVKPKRTAPMPKVTLIKRDREKI